MSKPVSVSEVLESISAKKNAKGKIIKNRFSEKSFNKLLAAMFNDPDFTTEVAVVKAGQLDTVEKIKVSEGFRNFCRRLLEQAGMDSADSAVVLNPEFTISEKMTEGLYEFMATAIYIFIEKGNKFDFIPKPDFKGSIYLNEVDEKIVEKEAIHPATRESLGMFKTTKGKHKELRTKSPTPKYLCVRKKLK